MSTTVLSPLFLSVDVLALLGLPALWSLWMGGVSGYFIARTFLLPHGPPPALRRRAQFHSGVSAGLKAVFPTPPEALGGRARFLVFTAGSVACTATPASEKVPNGR